MIVLTSIDLSPFLEFNKETNPSKIYSVLPIFIVFHSFSKLHDSITLQTLKCIGELTNFQYNISSWLKYILYFMKPSCKLLKFRYFAWFFLKKVVIFQFFASNFFKWYFMFMFMASLHFKLIWVFISQVFPWRPPNSFYQSYHVDKLKKEIGGCWGNTWEMKSWIKLSRF